MTWQRRKWPRKIGDNDRKMYLFAQTHVRRFYIMDSGERESSRLRGMNMWKFLQSERESAGGKTAVERRKLQRISMLLTVNCRTRGERESVLLLTENISARGMRFVSEQELEEGRELDLQFLLYSNLPPVQARGYVVWCQQQEKNGRTLATGGVSFSCIDENHAAFLQRYIDKHALTSG